MGMGKRGGRPYTFDLNEMLKLRVAGWGYSALGRKFNLDHTTIIYHCKKFNVHPSAVALKKVKFWRKEKEEESVLTPMRPYKYDYLLYEKMNPGKNYAQYLKDVEKRKSAKIWVIAITRHA